MSAQEPKKLGLLDSTLLVSGSMIGSGIFIVSTLMLRDIGSPAWLLVLWILTGLITIFAALSYGELAGMMPNAGGQYVYIQRAYGKMTSFLYGWTVFTVIQTGVIAAVAVMRGDADAMIAGLEGRFHSKLRNIRDIIGLREGVRDLSAMTLMITSKGNFFLADTHVTQEPSAEDIADIIHFVVSRPYHVNIADLVVMPTAKANSGIVNRSL